MGIGRLAKNSLQTIAVEGTGFVAMRRSLTLFFLTGEFDWGILMDLVNIKTNRIVKCAFCKHWYDPTNATLKMVNPSVGFWEYNPRMKSRCSENNVETVAA